MPIGEQLALYMLGHPPKKQNVPHKKDVPETVSLFHRPGSPSHKWEAKQVILLSGAEAQI
jgi:hypothetical protein